MKKIVLMALVVVGAAASVRGQTANELKTQYREVKSYEVRPGIQMTAWFGEDGQVCRMSFQPQVATGENSFNGLGMDWYMAKDTVNRLVPMRREGSKLARAGLASEASL
jgi:hypothetical protein